MKQKLHRVPEVQSNCLLVGLVDNPDNPETEDETEVAYGSGFSVEKGRSEDGVVLGEGGRRVGGGGGGEGEGAMLIKNIVGMSFGD